MVCDECAAFRARAKRAEAERDEAVSHWRECVERLAAVDAAVNGVPLCPQYAEWTVPIAALRERAERAEAALRHIAVLIPAAAAEQAARVAREALEAADNS